MKEAFGIAATNTNRRRDKEIKKKQDRNLLKLVVDCWLETLMKEKGLEKQQHLGVRKCIRLLQRKMKMV